MFFVDSDANENDCTYTELIFTMCPEILGLIPGIANPTGVALMIILTVMVVCSLPFVRKSGYFEVSGRREMKEGERWGRVRGEIRA